MKLAQFTALALFAISSATFAADEPKPPARPPGIKESNWIPITETYGFAITQDTTGSTKTSGSSTIVVDGVARRYAPTTKSFLGYYAVRRGAQWCRIDVEPNPPAIVPAVNR